MQPAVTIQTLGDSWVKTSWDDYCQLLAQPAQENTRGYYYKGLMRLDMALVSPDHAEGDHLMALAVNLFSITRHVPLKILSNCSYQRSGTLGCQADISVYFGAQVSEIPFGANLIDLDQHSAPALVIEIAQSSLSDDLGIKRALYEALGVQEYWVVDVATLSITAYQIVDLESYQIQESQLLPGLNFRLLEMALRQSRTTDHQQVGAWLLSQFQQLGT
ncbi:Uma2 family endonuclease [Thermosynechococcaceae cyanobacterium BACA0444]|uniref:Uma2 family endonuclease n=1 Tax=Pseudocalidococcus azoricus BACA0444 TaxID=2918990 RepID=A0AAE4FPZ0_9CYAN|nr:Uma2 family endonuclease [Pseudocalidococcus azoricus]MDS3859372.1 Uma2 family endonuclease [Pseudocalidococcus azoricus BACA0444]